MIVSVVATTLQFQKRPAVILVGVIALLALVFGAGRSISRFADRVATTRERTLTAIQFAAVNGEAGTPRGGSLTVDEQEMSNAQLDFMAFPLQFQPNANHQLTLSSGGKSFLLGPLVSADRDATTGVLVYRFSPEAGDEVSFTIERSVFPWPTPFQMNFMTGAPTATWGRALYYRLRWKKPTGARLEMVWTYDQAYFSSGGWKAVWTRGGSGGLMRVEIQP